MDNHDGNDEMKRVKRGWILLAATLLGLFTIYLATEA